MVKQADIIPATLRDVTYVLYNLRPLDELELSCQLPDGLKRDAVAYDLLMNSYVAYTGHLRGHPEMVFGVSLMNAACVSIWALGTVYSHRLAPAIVDHVLEAVVPHLIDDGYLTMEARSLVDHVEAHRWMKSAGAKQVGDAFEYGKAREKFLLFRWTHADFDAIRQSRRRAA